MCSFSIGEIHANRKQMPRHFGQAINVIEWLKDYKFNMVIHDESQAIKNPQSLRFKAVYLLQAKKIITLTGTPIENNTFDLYAQMHFANPGIFGNAKSFKENFSTPIDKNGDRERAEERRRIINPFIIRRTKEQVAKNSFPLYCYMNRYMTLTETNIAISCLAK